MAVAKALADRSTVQKVWYKRTMALERANAAMGNICAAADELNKLVAELQSSPLYTRAMAEMKARDMTIPGWSSGFSAPPRQEGDVEEDISFEDLLSLEKEAGVITGSGERSPDG